MGPAGWNIAGRSLRGATGYQGATGPPGVRCQAIRPNGQARAAASVRLAAPGWPRTGVTCLSQRSSSDTNGSRGIRWFDLPAAISRGVLVAAGCQRQRSQRADLDDAAGPTWDGRHQAGPLPLSVP